MPKRHQSNFMRRQHTEYSLLVQFKDTKLSRDLVKSKIRDHLLQFRGKNATNPDELSSELINHICKYASRLFSLNFSAKDGFHRFAEAENIHIPSEFQPKWLNNVGILLPNVPEIIEILPYLLTCYAQNASKNRIDPFTGKGGSGYMDIFQQYDDGQQNELGVGNRSRSITQLAHYFTDLTEIEFSVLERDPMRKPTSISGNSQELFFDSVHDMDSAEWKKSVPSQKNMQRHGKGIVSLPLSAKPVKI